MNVLDLFTTNGDRLTFLCNTHMILEGRRKTMKLGFLAQLIEYVKYLVFLSTKIIILVPRYDMNVLFMLINKILNDKKHLFNRNQYLYQI